VESLSDQAPGQNRRNLKKLFNPQKERLVNPRDHSMIKESNYLQAECIQAARENDYLFVTQTLENHLLLCHEK
jgi:hypothetical protein